MKPSLRLCLVLHNHQPIGNFDGVFQQAYEDSYLPFLDVFEDYSDLAISLHTSGPLMEWLDQHHPEYLDRVRQLVAEGRIEIIGGAFYEPILTMIPSRDRIGQIRSYTRWLEDRLGGPVQGMWVPERVWEQSLSADIEQAGIGYTVLDDFHFRNAGLVEDQLHGYYVTEDDGRLLSVFPGSERLRYLIPFGQPHETIDYLRGIAERHPGSVAVFGDDGEKFGTWPDTHRHVYQDGWLRRFFDALVEQRDWLLTTTLAETTKEVPPTGKIYLPDGSYREMTEWALPVEQQQLYDTVTHEMEHDPRWPRLKPFLRGGFWRNFKVKYPEANEMYCRMMMVSRRLEQLVPSAGAGHSPEQRQLLDEARQALYRGQCNCSYWHGAFGGIYLPHLRNAVYQQLIVADTLLDQVEGKPAAWSDADVEDFNFDARQEVRLANDKLVCLASPASGGHLYELDSRSIGHNLLATLTRRPEAYHRKVLAGPSNNDDGVSSIHERVVFKQEGLDQRLQYDAHPRKSLVDHFYDNEATLESVRDGHSLERGDFAAGIFQSKVRRSADRVQLQLVRQGNAWGIPITLTKAITLVSGSSQLEVTYLLEGVPQDRPLHFSVEFNFAGLPSGADDRFFHRGEERLGHLGSSLDLRDETELGMTDQWLGIDVRLGLNRPSHIWTFPIETVSQSEGGFELVHQSLVAQPHWLIRGDAQGRWSVTMTLQLDTSQAEQRLAESQTEAAVS